MMIHTQYNVGPWSSGPLCGLRISRPGFDSQSDISIGQVNFTMMPMWHPPKLTIPS